jgi:NAD(P)H-dependent FMN reductase
MRSLNHVRQLLTNLGAWVIPEQFALGGAASAFADNGTLTDARSAQQLQQVASHLLSFIQTTKQA